MTNADRRSVAQLVSDATNQISTLIRDEIRLAVTELPRKGKRLGVGAGFLGGGGLVALYGVGALIGKKQAEHGVPPVPEEAVASIKQDIAALKEGAQR